MSKVLVTGATGFVGRTACAALEAAGIDVRATARKSTRVSGAKEVVQVPSLDRFEDWGALLDGITCIVHLANVAHVGAEGLAQARGVNVDATARLAEAAADVGVTRFVYVSSAKVHGEETADAPFDERTALAPQDPYSALKVEAEKRLGEIASRGGLELVTVRPPLVYGPGVKANFLALMRALDRGWPLPFASIENRRSVIYVGNLADAIVRCIESPAAAGKTYLVSDGTPVSTPGLCRALGVALGRPARLFPIPSTLLELAPPLRKLTRSLEVDDSAIRRELGWTPPFSFEEGIRATAAWYLEEARRARG